MSQQIFVNNIGTEFIISITDNDVIVDISSATTLHIIFQKPDSTSLTVDASLYTDGTDGVIHYIDADGSLDQSGFYKIQTYIEIDGGSFYSSIGTFKVYCNLV